MFLFEGKFLLVVRRVVIWCCMGFCCLFRVIIGCMVLLLLCLIVSFCLFVRWSLIRGSGWWFFRRWWIGLCCFRSMQWRYILSINFSECGQRFMDIGFIVVDGGDLWIGGCSVLMLFGFICCLGQFGCCQVGFEFQFLGCFFGILRQVVLVLIFDFVMLLLIIFS